MDAKYIKKEIADLNGTGRTQAYYKMVTRVMNHEQFIDVLMRDGSLPRSTYKAVLTQIAEKLPGCLANGFSVKIDEVGLFTARLGVRKDMLPDAFEPGETKRNASSIEVKHVIMRVKHYADMTGLSKTTASLELRKISKDPASGITFQGRGSQKFYILRSQDTSENNK